MTNLIRGPKYNTRGKAFVGPRFSAAAEAISTLPSRKNIRLTPENYRGCRFYFVTVCFYRRRALGAERRIAVWLASALRQAAAAQSFLGHAWCIMPDHLHILAEGTNEGSDLLSSIGDLKRYTGYQFSHQRKQRLWQFKFYDHILRKADAFESVAWYIWLNPARKGLCVLPADYPFLGSFTETGLGILRSTGVTVWTPPWKEHLFCRVEARPYIKKQMH